MKDHDELLGQVRKKARKPSKRPEAQLELPPDITAEAQAVPIVSKPEQLFKERGEFWAFFGPGLIITLLGFLLAYSFVGPPPPKKLRFASGSGWGAYNRCARQYQALLAKQGLQIEVLETQGSAENLRLLSSGEADIAFVQGGLLPEDPSVPLVALGSVYYEPIWIFVRSQTVPRELDDLQGLRLAIGQAGSGTQVIALEILNDAGLNDDLTMVEVGGEQAEAMFLSGQLDALFLVGSPDIAVISRMLTHPDAQLMQLSRVRAIERRHQFLSTIPLYEGVVDLDKDIPPNDVDLLALTATLVVREGFHKALPGVILGAAREIHGHGSILSEHDEFPSPQYCSFPIVAEARHFYQYGTSFLYRHLSFRWASALDRMAILLLPFVGLLVPIVRLLPPLYSWSMKRKIYRRYRALQRLEARIGNEDTERLLDELDALDEGARSLSSMPAAYSADIYALRTHLDRVRVRLRRLEVDAKAKFAPAAEARPTPRSELEVTEE